jgi:hypothetical protein
MNPYRIKADIRIKVLTVVQELTVGGFVTDTNDSVH